MTNSAGNISTSVKSNIEIRPSPIQEYIAPEGSTFSLTNLEFLRKTFKNEFTRVASFVGAGPSKPLGVRDWRTMMGALVTEAGGTFLTQYGQLVNNTDGEEIDPEQYPLIAEEVYNSIENKRYNEVIKKQIEYSTNSSNPTLENLVRAIRVHLTTNFEKCIEQSYLRLKTLAGSFGGTFDRHLQVKYYNQATSFPPSENTDWLCYLHADLSQDPPIFILRKKAYDAVYKHAGGASDIYDCIKQFYTRKHIVFMGFSFDDPYFDQCFRAVANEEKRNKEIYKKHFGEHGRSGIEDHLNKPIHFLLIDSGENNRLWHQLKDAPTPANNVSKRKSKYFEYWQEIGIYPIVYKSNKHIFVEYLLEEFASMRDAD